MFIPGLLLGFASCWHCGILKTFFDHPSILLMPVFTHFTFASSIWWCKGSSKEEEEEEVEEGEKKEKAGGGATEEPFIIFSAKFTILNLLISTMGSVAYCLSMRHFDGKLWKGIPSLLFYYLHEPHSLIPFILVPILGLLLTLLSLLPIL